MVEPEERALDEIQHGSDSLLFGNQVLLIERYHPHDDPGVSPEVLDTYAEALAARPDSGFDVESFRQELDSWLTGSKTWVSGDRVYELNSGNISRYPETWHDRLGGEADVRQYIAFLQDDVPEFKVDMGYGGAGRGIPEQPLLDVVAILGRIDRDDAKATLEDFRKQGVIAEDADQHPNAGVYLTDRDEEYGDPSLGYTKR